MGSSTAVWEDGGRNQQDSNSKWRGQAKSGSQLLERQKLHVPSRPHMSSTISWTDEWLRPIGGEWLGLQKHCVIFLRKMSVRSKEPTPGTGRAQSVQLNKDLSSVFGCGKRCTGCALWLIICLNLPPVLYLPVQTWPRQHLIHSSCEELKTSVSWVPTWLSMVHPKVMVSHLVRV